MANCLLGERDLTKRGAEVRRMLSPLSSDQGGPAWGRQTLRSEIYIGAFSKGSKSADIREWRFRTSVRGFYGNYFERWIPVAGGASEYFLDRAYLSIYFVNERATPPEEEIVLLQCDPNVAVTDNHARYKRGPHVHVSAAKHPLPHSHIALNLTHLDETVSSIDELTKAFASGVRLVREQVLALY